MIVDVTQYEAAQEEIRSLKHRLARLHEELAVYEGSKAAQETDAN